MTRSATVGTPFQPLGSAPPHPSSAQSSPAATSDSFSASGSSAERHEDSTAAGRTRHNKRSPTIRTPTAQAPLFKFMAITCIQARRHTVVGCATKELLPIYKKIGFRDTGIVYKHPQLNNVEHNLIIANARSSILGRDVGPIVWNVLWKDTAKYLIENELLVHDPMSHARVMAYKALNPLSILARRRSNKPRKKTKRTIENR